MNKIFFDVGANNGSSSIHVAESDPDTIVYAFEPTPEMISIIEEKSKNFNNYFLIRKAVSNFEGKSIFKVAGQSDWGCSSLLEFSDKSKTHWVGREDFKVTHEIEVDVIRLDSFIKEKNISCIDFLHIDTQGSDLNVLIGLGDYIDIVQSGVMEAASSSDILYFSQNTLEDSLKFLTDNGFTIELIQPNDVHNNEVNIFFSRKKI